MNQGETPLNETRTYRHSAVYFALLIVVVIVMGLGIATTLLTMSLPLVLLVGFFFLAVLGISLHTLTESVTLTDAEIIVRRLWIERSLRWGEIHRVHGTLRGLRLKNFDEDASVSLSSQLPGYEEVIEEIGRRRPDLFASPEPYNLERHPASLILGFVLGLALPGLGAWLAWGDRDLLFSGLIFAAIGIVMAAVLLLSVRAVVLEGETLTLKYPFRETTFRANEILDVQLDFQRTRNGRTYFVRLTLANRNTVRLSSLRCGTAVAYLVLKEWHRKHAPAGFSV